MATQRIAREPEVVADPDHRVVLHGFTWEKYEDLLSMLGENPGVRVAYLEGAVEIMSPSGTHERRKTLLGRLVEAWAVERGVSLNGYGSMTFRKAAKERGVEPDECYAVGREIAEHGDVPDIAIEVFHTTPLLDKLSIYAGLGVPEVWLFRRGVFEVYVLVGAEYQRHERSALLADLDLSLVASFIDQPDQTEAVRRFQRALRG
jgi:Uma2 family endonuclease